MKMRLLISWCKIWSLGGLPGNPCGHEILHEIIVDGDFDVIGSGPGGCGSHAAVMCARGLICSQPVQRWDVAAFGFKGVFLGANFSYSRIFFKGLNVAPFEFGCWCVWI